MPQDMKYKITMLPISKIYSAYPISCKHYLSEIETLKQSIEKNGLIQPIIVRKRSNGYVVISGERRLQACISAGFTEICSLVANCSALDGIILSLLSNSHQIKSDFIDKSVMINSLLNEWGITPFELSESLSMSLSEIRESLSLLKLSEKQRSIVRDADLTEEQALLSLKIASSERDKFLYYIANKGLNLNQTKLLTEKINTVRGKRVLKGSVPKDIRLFANTIENAVSSIQKMGVNAKMERCDTGDFIEYTVKIPKTQQLSPATVPQSVAI